MAYTDHFDTVQKLYIAYYQRPADPAGLAYWSKIIEVEGGDTTLAVTDFANAAESNDLYGPINASTITTVVKAIYTALFNRTPADDDAGLQFYVDGFNVGEFTPGRIALSIFDGARGADGVALQNKLAVANLFSKVVDGRALNDSDFGSKDFAVTYEGKEDAEAARKILKTVTADGGTKLNEAGVKQAIFDEKIVDTGDALDSTGSTLVLTEKNDETIRGTSGNDVFYAVIGKEATLNSRDAVIGNGGNDTIIIDFNEANSTTIPSRAQLNGIGKLVADYTGNSDDFSITGTNGTKDIKDIEVHGKVKDVTIQGFNNLQTVSITNNDGADLHYLTGKSINKVSISGKYSENTLGLKIDTDVKSLGVSVDNVTHGGTQTDPTFNLEIAKTVEALNFIADGGKSIISDIKAINATDSLQLKEITLTGKADFTVDLSDSSVSKVDKFNASDATGKLNITIGAIKNNASITGGDGDDTIILEKEGLASYVTLTGGDGEDTFDLTSNNASGNSSKFGVVTITDFNKDDKIKVNSTATAAVDKTNEIVSGLVFSINDILGSKKFTGTAANDKIDYFKFGNDAYLVIYGSAPDGSNGANDAELGSDDMIIKLANFEGESSSIGVSGGTITTTIS